MIKNRESRGSVLYLKMIRVFLIAKFLFFLMNQNSCDFETIRIKIKKVFEKNGKVTNDKRVSIKFYKS